MTIHYTIIPKDLSAHLFQVTLRIDQPDKAGQVLTLPAWIPGSYLVREFARHIVQIEASCKGKVVALTKLNKDSWQAAPVKGVLTVQYQVYAWDLSVRGAHLDRTHGFYNGTSVFLRVVGQEMTSHIVDIQKPVDLACKRWRVATSLPLLKAKLYGFGTYIAENYDELIDHPVEMGNFLTASFTACGVSHDVVITGHVPNIDLDRVARDLEKICTTQIVFFEPKTKRAPMERYVFLTMVVGDGYGGLEHRSSTALLCNRTDLPVLENNETSDAYINFLGLCSHEYFHSWNVKRIKPVEFAKYDLQQENYTTLLWLFEGFTSYYDDLMLLRSGIINEATYWGLVCKTFNGVMQGAGRLKQSLAESSFDAWTKYYRQDENAPNAIVSYYTKGSLFGLALDLTIQSATAGKKSLDHLMQQLWQEFGKDFYALTSTGQQKGVTAQRVEDIVTQLCGVDMTSFFDRYVRGTDDLPVVNLLEKSGVKLIDQRKTNKPSLGIKLSADGNDCKVAQVFHGSAAHLAGISAGDVIIAIDALRATAKDVPTKLSRLLERYQIGSSVTVHVFRRDEMMAFEVKLHSDDAPAWSLTVT